MVSLTWSTSSFIELQERLSRYSREDETLKDAINERLPDLKNLLEVPLKSDESRKKLSSGKLAIDGVEYSINNAFMTETCLLADDLSIDELVAAEYLIYGTECQAQLDRPPLQCAIVLFHTRRTFVLEIARMIFDRAKSSEVQDQDMFFEISRKLATKEFIQTAIKEMTNLRSFLRELQEKLTSGHLLGRDLDDNFVANIKFRRDQVFKELDALAQIIVLVAQLRFIDSDDIKLLLEGVSTVEKYDQISVLYMVGIIAGFEAMCLYTVQENEHSAKQTFDKAVIMQTYISERRRAPRSTLPYMHAAINLWWYVYFSGLCMRERELVSSSKIDYGNDIFNPALLCITTGGALEFMMVLAGDLSVHNDFLINRPALISNLLSKTLIDSQVGLEQNAPTKSLEIEIAYVMSSTFQTAFSASMESLVDAIISNTADLLKELRIREEESLTSDIGSEDLDSSDQFEERGGPELERFFMFVSFVYSGRSDSALQFWSDPEGNLYGFLVWASQCRSPLMIGAYCDMLSSLATGEECGLAAHRFMKEEDSDLSLSGGAVVRDHKTYEMSWDFILSSFDYYAQQLQNSSSDQNMLSSSITSRPLIATEDLPQLDFDNCLILMGYLRLLEQIATYSSVARSDLVGPNNTVNAFNQLFNLLRCQTPLTGSLLSTIRAFAVDASKEMRGAIWTNLDDWLLHSSILANHAPYTLLNTSGSWQNMPLRDKFNLHLTSVDDILAFVLLIECLTQIPVDGSINDLPYPEGMGSAYRSSPGLQPYVDYVAVEIFYSTSAVGLSTKQRLELQLACLKFMYNCINNFNIDLIDLSLSSGMDGSNGVNIELALHPKGLSNYIQAHPCVWTMAKLFEERVYSLLFSIVALGIDAITEPGPFRLKYNDVVRIALQVIYRVLVIQSAYTDVMEPSVRASVNTSQAVKGSSKLLIGMRSFEDAILFNIYVVPQFALYVNSEQVAVASLAIKILNRLASAPQFLNLNYDVPATGSYAQGIIPGISPAASFDVDQTRNRIGVNRLLSALDSVEESRRIMFGFITQLERPVSDYGVVGVDPEHTEDSVTDLKLEIMDFILRNLCSASAAKLDNTTPDMSLSDNLSDLSDVPTISHFLLGFKIGDGATAASTAVLQHNKEQGGIASEVSLFKSIVGLLTDGVTTASFSDQFTKRSYSPVRIAGDIIYKLCVAKISSRVTLELLRLPEYAHFKSRLSAEPLVTISNSRWGSYTFKNLVSGIDEDNYNLENTELPLPALANSQNEEEEASNALLQFFIGRTMMLEYLSVELHNASSPMTTTFESYVKQLIVHNDSDSPAQRNDWSEVLACETSKFLELLDFLEFDIEKLATIWKVGTKLREIKDILQDDLFEGNIPVEGSENVMADLVSILYDVKIDALCLYSLPPLASATPGLPYPTAPIESVYNLKRVRELLELKIREQIQTGNLRYPLSEALLKANDKIVHAATRHNAIVLLRRAQGQCLAAWGRLLRTLLVDTVPVSDSHAGRFVGRDTVILETMQVVAPKLLHYSHVWQSRVAEHLASASVFLLSANPSYLALDDSTRPEIFSADVDDDVDAAADIAHTLFHSSLIAVQSPHASPSVRADLYTLINIFICSHPARQQQKLVKLQNTIQSCANGISPSPETYQRRENRLVEQIATDAVSGDSVTRVMALIVLRAFAAVENATGKFFLLEALVKYNLLLLLVRSIKRIDEDLDKQNRGARLSVYLTVFNS
ncbi:nucleoporin Nup186/Nup192/Nup205 [Lipomyces arxii]|uniref:nucleoporin Nup186/Nup192/Nup205 n=1 Tax=Lipomyces arxii TaxID=56418 RepID=UPI0034CFBB7E